MAGMTMTEEAKTRILAAETAYKTVEDKRHAEIAAAGEIRCKVGWASPEAGAQYKATCDEIEKRYRPELTALAKERAEAQKAAGHFEGKVDGTPARGGQVDTPK